MKKAFTLLYWGFFSFALIAQAPQGINYQAIARNPDGEPVGNTTLAVKFEIFSNVQGIGAPIFDEDQAALTDPVTGLFNLTIGAQDSTEFSGIDWASGSKFLRVTINGVKGPITQMLSVPYALYAKNAGSSSGDNDTNPTNELQILQVNGTQLSILPGGNSIPLPSQQLSINGDQLSISNGNTVPIDGSVTNELQTLILNGNTLSLNPNGGFVNLPPGSDDQTLSVLGNQLSIENGNTVSIDGSITNEIQTLTLNGNQLSIINGNSVMLPTYTAGQGITISGNVISNSGDLSSSNELQTLILNGNTLMLNPSGGFVNLPSGSDDQTLSVLGNQLSIENGNTVTLPTGTTYSAGTGIAINANVISNTGDSDNSVTNELQTLSISSSQLSISNGNTVPLPTYQPGAGISINGSTISANDASAINELQQLQLNNNTGVLSLLPSGGSVTLPSSYIVPSNPGTTCNTGFLPFDCSQCVFGPPAFRVNNICDGTAIEGVSVASAGAFAALKGTTTGIDGNGIWGECNNGNEAWAVFGTSNNGWGIVGFSGNPNNEGAGLFNGRIIVTNTLQSSQMANWGIQSHTRYTWSGVQTSSDIRLKKNIESLNYGLKEVLAMRPVSYLWKSDDENSKKTLGFIAQEMVGIVPELVEVPAQEEQVNAGSNNSNSQKLVDSDTDQTWAMNYNEITPVLVKAVQEQQAQIESLRATVLQKDEQIREMSARMEAIESLLKNMQESAGK